MSEQHFLLLSFVFIIVYQCQAAVVGPPRDPEYELLMELAGRYRMMARHWRENQTILPFEFYFPVHEVIHVNGATNEYSIRASIQLIYQFDFLRWNLKETTDELVFTQAMLESLILPDIFNVDEDLIHFKVEHESARLTRDGRLTWTRRGLFRISAHVDLTFYPFDHQHLQIEIHHRQNMFNLQYEENQFDPMIDSRLARLTDRRMIKSLEMETNNSNETERSSTLIMNDPILSRGWFVRIISILPTENNRTFEYLTMKIYFQRRRESHIYTTILPTLFLSVFIFVFYFSSIETHQRLVMTLIHILATFLFIVHIDRKMNADQLSSSPMLIKYLSLLFIIEILSLFFDHIIHSIYYGGVHFAARWFNQNENDESSSARLASVTLLNNDFPQPNLDLQGPEFVLKQIIEREESTKFEDLRRKQWHKHARLSECLCCAFFLIVIVLSFFSMFFIIPTFSLYNN